MTTIREMFEKKGEAMQRAREMQDLLRDMQPKMRSLEDRIFHDAGSTATVARSYEGMKEEMQRFSTVLAYHTQVLLDEWRVLRELVPVEEKKG